MCFKRLGLARSKIHLSKGLGKRSGRKGREGEGDNFALNWFLVKNMPEVPKEANKASCHKLISKNRF